MEQTMLNTGSLFWVVPAVFALFALAFGMVAYKEREARSAQWASLGFCAAAFGSIVDTQRSHLPEFCAALATPSHWLCIFGLMQAMLARQGDRFSRLWLSVWAVPCFAAHLYFVLIHPSVPSRIMLMNISVPALLLIAFIPLRRSAKQAIDKVLVGLVGTTILTYPIRIAIFFAQNEAHEVAGPWVWSQYIIIFYLVMSMIGVLTALALMLATGMDIIALHHKTSATDPLTGIGNRRAFDRCVDEDAHHGTIYDAALMIDLDRFKALNDRHGHAAGDAVLIGVARELEAKLCGFCDIARIGGEEFVALVKSSSGDSVTSLSLIARAAIASAIPDAPYDALRITASIGIAIREPDEHLRDTLKRADIALYHAKTAGRNRAMQAESRNGLSTVRAVAA
jgi:diguanylate cyclase (GGDEF)-like protein